jgi:hypothetical protein
MHETQVYHSRNNIKEWLKLRQHRWQYSARLGSIQAGMGSSYCYIYDWTLLSKQPGDKQGEKFYPLL